MLISIRLQKASTNSLETAKLKDGGGIARVVMGKRRICNAKEGK